MLLEIHDNLVSREMVNELFESIHQPVYRYGQKSKPDDTFPFWIANITEDIAASVKSLNSLITVIDENITKGQFDVQRMYVNAYNFGDCPTVHVDNISGGYFTVLYYANPKWHADWSGETVFYNEAQNEIIKSIYPTPGRMVFFDSRIPHAARTPSRICNIVRYTIAVKLIEK